MQLGSLALHRQLSIAVFIFGLNVHVTLRRLIDTKSERRLRLSAEASEKRQSRFYIYEIQISCFKVFSGLVQYLNLENKSQSILNYGNDVIQQFIYWIFFYF